MRLGPDCKTGDFGIHSGARAGEGCAGCDAEHAYLMAKHIGDGPYVDPFDAGAAVAFGLMGMAEAIRVRMGYRSTLWREPVPARPIAFPPEWCEEESPDRSPASDKST